MDSLAVAALMGVVEGLTEFLPVSSTGHLILAGDILGVSGPSAATFEIVIQAGAILAVVLLYWSRFWGLLFPPRAAAAGAGAPRGQSFAGLRGIGLLLLTSLPGGLLGLAGGSVIKSLFTPASVALALGTGAVCMLAVEAWVARRDKAPNASPAASVGDSSAASLDDLTARQALGIGFFQCLALWPGFSRSASTIMGGMLLGLPRKLAAEYSFIAAVPLIVAASGYDMLKSRALLSAADVPFFAVGTAVSFVAALVAIKTFIALLGKTTLRPFAVYRLLIIVPVYWFMVR